MSSETNKKQLSELRSQRWFEGPAIRQWAHRQRTQQMGMRREEFLGKPVIGIINTWSDMSPCHAHLRDRAEAVKRGVWQAGGYPVELPALSVGEVLVKPTTMLYRNFLAMETEELLRSHPIDGCVLLGGCDKSGPGLLMGAISMNVPTIFCPAGTMSNDQWRGIPCGAGTHTKKFWNDLQTGKITSDDWVDLEQHMTRSVGTCNTMGTASTMTSIIDAMGLSKTGASSTPAADAAHPRMASWCGSRIVEMVWEDLKPSDIITPESLANGIVTYMALGGSTNAAVHLIAMAARANVPLTLDDLSKHAVGIPVLANLFPTGDRFMEDLWFAGGLPALMNQLGDRIHKGCITVEGRTIGESIKDAPIWDDYVIRSMDNPVVPIERGVTLKVLHGNIAPDGAVIKTSAADPNKALHRGPALVFDDHGEMNRCINDPDLNVTADTVLILRNAGPVGGPGMPEWGNLPIPKKLVDQGVTDIVRICDGRMSGTHYGTCVLHVAPEAAVGGPLALVENGDIIKLDINAGRIDVEVDDEELARRRTAWKKPESPYSRSFAALYQQHVSQADKGCDFGFLEGTDPVPEPVIY
ncbi:dihydroxy-acid dehydratase [Cohaesibacter sp. ES.047]|uniref:IlvD/Edd family dehydratase n=1 Tax=Cohaesibacter sp. ES.047 TaxID=1798205 RepID=UPI000BB89499|nr:IlvD/Edd family dehydratase [Cohaesibacter sp. ES.047]SNY91089.1 dihydroxy-acid dehydratase [Cohaesibacter sp. ES.047]